MAPRKKKDPYSHYSAAKVPAFVEAVQPAFIWRQLESHDGSANGFVQLPKTKKKRDAVIVSPSGNTMIDRAVRVHELLHARLSPSIGNFLLKAKRNGLSSLAINYAEDTRINRIGIAAGAYKACDAYCTIDVAKGVVKPTFVNAESYRGFGVNPIYDVVKCYIGLSSYPFDASYDPSSLEELAIVIETECDGMVIWNYADKARVEALVAQYNKELDAIFAKSWRGKQAASAQWVAIATLIETTLRAAKLADAKKRSPNLYEAEQILADLDKQPQSGGAAAGPADAGEKKKSSRPKADKPAWPELGKSNIPDEAAANEKHRRNNALMRAANAEKRKEEEKKEAVRAAVQQIETALDDAEKRRKDLDEARYKEAERVAKRVAECIHGRSSSSFSTDKVAGTVTVKEGVRVTLPDGKDVTVSMSREAINGRGAPWGRMFVHTPSLTRPKRHLAPRDGGASPDGVYPRHLSRWMQDRSIMSAQGRRPGGALLIDISGSMDWAHENTAALIDACPALTVAVYSSASPHGLKYGSMTILAKNGKLVSPTDKWRSNHGYGNVCDGPALSWLIKQAGPRVWFCDGAVTGEYDCGEVDLKTDALRLCMLGRVTRTVSIERTKAILTGRERETPYTAADLGRHIKSWVHFDINERTANEMDRRRDEDAMKARRKAA